jgi:hypothetical protein
LLVSNIPGNVGRCCASTERKGYQLLPPQQSIESSFHNAHFPAAGDLDDAVIDRMDEAIHFDLPGREQRGKLLALYLDKYISKAGTEQVRREAIISTLHGNALIAQRKCCGTAALGWTAEHKQNLAVAAPPTSVQH